VLISLLGIFVITFAGFYLAIRRIHQKNLLSLLTGYEKFRFKRFWFAFSVWALLLVFSVIGSYLFDPKSLSFNLNWQGFGISLLMMLLMMPIQTGFEEVFFRGYLVQGLSQVFKNGIVPVLITSVLFGAAHLSNPEVREYGWAMMLTYYIFFALFMGCLTLLDEGIELAFGIHFANNLVSSILVNSPNSVLKTYSIFDSKVENPSGEIILWFVMAIVTFVILRVKYKWKHFALIVK
jgi:membrane protease YdiL (CAAX protease family)